MIYRKVLFGIFLGFFISCSVTTQENPVKMFTDLVEKYKKAEHENIISKQSEGFN
jgi:hypothetical protein